MRAKRSWSAWRRLRPASHDGGDVMVGGMNNGSRLSLGPVLCCADVFDGDVDRLRHYLLALRERASCPALAEAVRGGPSAQPAPGETAVSLSRLRRLQCPQPVPVAGRRPPSRLPATTWRRPTSGPGVGRRRARGARRLPCARFFPRYFRR